MRRFITLFLFVFTLTGVVLAQMSDNQIIQYVKEGQKQGKSQQQMASELAKRGVTRDQVERIKNTYEESQVSDSKTDILDNKKIPTRINPGENTTAGSFDEIKQDFADPTEMKSAKAATKLVFGRDAFTNRNLSFEPSVNLATPPTYRLGPGDEVIIDIWGSSENTIRQVISPEGNIMVSNIGPVYLNGMTVTEANAYLQKEFSKIYSAIAGNSSEIKLTLGQIRTIQINIMGEASVPGTYALSSFSTVFHALYRAGGVSQIGSLRSIQVMRNNKKIADIDVYDYILRGKTGEDLRLMEGDVILIPTYDCLVEISGKVKRPMFYEMKKGETIATLLKYAGGFTGDAYEKNIRLNRLSGREKQIYNVDEMDYSVFKLNDEDALTVGSVLDRYENRVEIRGAVYREGMYQINGGVKTVKDLINKAEGLRGDAFLNRAQLQREHEDLTLEIIPIDLKGMLDGVIADIPLMRNDILYIPSIHDLKEEDSLTIHGEVRRPGIYVFAEKTSLEDLIMQAGGLKEAASTVRIDVARRIKNPKGIEPLSTIGEMFCFEMKDGYLLGNNEFYLQPFDEVYVRKSPAYQQQLNVTVGGEILFEGEYALVKKNERLSDLVSRAGGITPDAYAKGARLVRQVSAEEKARTMGTLRMASHTTGKDSISVGSLELEDTYYVGIELEKALENPNSSYDLVLREGDHLFIPKYINTIKINGAVMYPNTVLYQPGKKIKHYLDQSGGFTTLARKNKIYVVYLNGTVARVKSGDSKSIQPGCEIIVPTKEERKKMTTGEIVSMSASVASLAMMVATLVNLIK